MNKQMNNKSKEIYDFLSVIIRYAMSTYKYSNMYVTTAEEFNTKSDNYVIFKMNYNMTKPDALRLMNRYNISLRDLYWQLKVKLGISDSKPYLEIINLKNTTEIIDSKIIKTIISKTNKRIKPIITKSFYNLYYNLDTVIGEYSFGFIEKNNKYLGLANSDKNAKHCLKSYDFTELSNEELYTCSLSKAILLCLRRNLHSEHISNWFVIKHISAGTVLTKENIICVV